MSMMEKAALQMLQNMTGLTPYEMRAMIEASVLRIASVDQKLDRILTILEAQPQHVKIIEQEMLEDKSNAKVQ